MGVKPCSPKDIVFFSRVASDQKGERRRAEMRERASTAKIEGKGKHECQDMELGSSVLLQMRCASEGREQSITYAKQASIG